MPTLLRIDDHIRTIGTIPDEHLEFLRDHLVRESEGDRDYFIDRDTIVVLVEKGAPPSLLELLRNALGPDDGMDIAWRDGDPLVGSAARGPFR